jgi:hypothetical protein
MSAQLTFSHVALISRDQSSQCKNLVPMTLGNMRTNGVRTLAEWCLGRGRDHSRVRDLFSI